jgi:hypothetical protein
LKHIKTVILWFLILLQLFSGFQIILAPYVFAKGTYEVGVNVGDWAKYDFFVSWTSNPPYPEPLNIEEAQQINYSIFEVKDVSATTLTIAETIYFKNSSQTSKIYVGDVKTKEGNLTFQVIAKNLNKGDKIWDIENAPVINETRPEPYAGSTRMVNLLDFQIGTGIGNWTWIQFFWDRDTGFQCEMTVLNSIIFEKDDTLYEVQSLTKWVIAETNLWNPETPTSIPWWVSPAVLIGIAIVIYVVLKKRQQKSSRRPR